MSVILSAEELNGMRIRGNLLMSKNLELQLLNKENSDYKAAIFNKYKLDNSKKYNIDDRGVVSEHTDKHSVIPEVKPAGSGDSGTATEAVATDKE